MGYKSEYYGKIVGTIIIGIIAGLIAAYFDNKGDMTMELVMFGTGIIIAGVLYYFNERRDNELYGKIEDD